MLDHTPPKESICAVSVVIPMYNVEKYIAETLDSLLAQTFQDFEVIIVNDCSPDKSREIAESYLEKFDGRLKIFDNEKNSGPSDSRNNGLLKSCGEYVFFMDSDDLILPNGLAEMYRFAKLNDADFVSFTIRCNVDEDGKILEYDKHKYPALPKNFILIDDSKAAKYADIKNPESIKKTKKLKSILVWRIKILSKLRFPWEIWLKFLRRDFLLKNELFFHKDVYLAEDHVWTYGIFFCAKKIVHVPKVFYHHRMSQNSIVRTKRTPVQEINLWVSTFTNGIGWIDNVMSKLEFFQKSPGWRHVVLEYFSARYFRKILKHSLKLKQHEIYGAIKQTYSEKFGEQAVLISELITYTNTQQKKIAKLEKQLKVK